MSGESTGRPVIGRRSLLLGAGAALVLAGCAAEDSGPTASSAEGGAGAATSGSTVGSTVTQAPLTAAEFDDLGPCQLLPELTPGPFPLDRQLDRRDITEGYPGHPLRLGLRVVDQACDPVPGAAVEVWHTDATGDYSAFTDNGGGKDEGAGTTFLRGTQQAGDDGIVEFATIYPGWYPGRAVHIHVRVHLDGATVLTTQLFFDDEVTASVFGETPYADFGLPDTTNAQDAIAGVPERDGTLLLVRPAQTGSGGGSVGLANLGVPA